VGEGLGERGSINTSPVCNWRLLGTNGKACGERALSNGLRSSDETKSESDDLPGTFEINGGIFVENYSYLIIYNKKTKTSYCN